MPRAQYVAAQPPLHPVDAHAAPVPLSAWLRHVVLICLWLCCAACGQDDMEPARGQNAPPGPGTVTRADGETPMSGTATGDGAAGEGGVGADPSQSENADAAGSQAPADVAAIAGGAGAAAGDEDTAAHDAGAASSSCAPCADYAPPEQLGTLEPDVLEALSGLAHSRTQPDILFAHNDRARPEVYALDRQGRLHATISLDQAPATDIEDIAVGPCDAGFCVYLADIGDNAARRGQYEILRFAEPDIPSEPGTTEIGVAFERLPFRYEDGSHNAEGLMVAPDGTLYVVTKLAPASGGRVAATGPSSVYALRPPLSPDSVAEAVAVATLPVPADGDLAASAAAAHPCGLGFVIRTYDRIYEFRAAQGATFESAFFATPSTVGMPDEPQSEGIDYTPDGRALLSSGEGLHAAIFSTVCR